MMFRSYSDISQYFLRDYGTIAMVIILVAMVTTTTVISSRVKINLLLTEREGRTGEYWPEVVAVRTERSEVRTKRPRANIPRYGSS